MDASLIGRRGQPGRPTAGMSATKRICQPGYQAGRNLHSSARAPSSRSRRPRLVPVQGRGRPDHLRRQGALAPQPALELLPGPGPPAPAHRADGGAGRLGRVDRRRERRRGDHARVQPDQGAPAPLQHPPRRRQELPVPGGHRRRRVAEGRRSCGAPSARTPATSGPTRTPTRSARPSTCCSGRSRSGPARTPSSGATSSSGGRACCSTSSGARVLVSARSSTEEYGKLVDELMAFLDGDTKPVVDRLEAEMRQAAGGARVRAGGPPARPARDGPARDRAPGDGHRHARGPRRHRASPRTSSPRPCRSSTSGAGASSAGTASSSRRWSR